MTTLAGSVSLNLTAVAIPVGGLSVSSLRVEVAEEGKEAGWVAELIVHGRLPWHSGETREVEVRIMSDEFRTHVASKRPKLIVKRGSETIGILDLT